MLRKLLITAIAAAILAAAALWILTAPQSVAAGSLAARTPDLANGRTMFLAGGCSSCHMTQKQKDATRLGGGLRLHTAFGEFYAPNISPDPKDGIGAWTEANFVTAMTRGVAPDGSHLYPAFPYPSYARMRIDDIRDLFAYLKTLPPVEGRAPPHALKFPFNIRRAVGVWKLLFFADQTFTADPGQSAEWNRGAYLVNAPGHCAECHSPRNILGAVVESRRFDGGPSPTDQGGVPSIRQDKLADWKVEDFVATLTTGDTPDSDRVGGPMVDVVRNTAQLSDADRHAMAVYIKSLPPPK
ncbi:MAG: c-type cytochrome [Pseudolabrys sp.]